MIVVVDTDVFVGACLGVEPSNRALARCLRGEHTALIGAVLLTEFEAVLDRTDIFLKSRLSRSERDQLLDIFLSTCRWTRIYSGWYPNLQDERDNHLIELAVAGGASHIISRNDRDLVRMKLKFPGLRIMNPDAFLRDAKA